MIQTARKYLGVPFRHGGRNPETGGDCAGLLAWCFTHLGIPFDDFLAYGQGQDNLSFYEERLSGPCARCEVSDAAIVLFRFRTVMCHAAVTDGQTMIHIPGGYRSVCVEEPLTEVWRARVWSAWRLRGLGLR